MPTNFQFPIAPVSVLTLLGSVASTLLATATAGVLALRRRKRWAALAAGVALCVPLGYAVLLGVFAVFSGDVTVPIGAEKYFCDVDCHTAYSVLGVEKVADLGVAHTQGQFLVVSLRTRFDAGTIGPRRGNALLYPNPKVIEVVDAAGQHWALDPALQQRLAAARGAQTPLEQALGPGEAYVTQLAFDVSRASGRPRLLVTEADWFARLLLGHETAPWHGKTYMALE